MFFNWIIITYPCLLQYKKSTFIIIFSDKVSQFYRCNIHQQEEDLVKQAKNIQYS